MADSSIAFNENIPIVKPDIKNLQQDLTHHFERSLK
jgi:hypothetical protein